LEGSVGAFALSLRIKSRRDDNRVGFGGELLCFVTDNTPVTCDAKLHTGAEPGGPPMLLQHHFVRRGCKRKPRLAHDFPGNGPVIEDELVIEIEAIEATVFTGG